MNIVAYEETNYNEPIQEFVDKLNETQLKYLASDLLHFGLTEAKEIEEAVSRAMLVCRSAGLSVKQHFRPVYIYKRRDLICDWRLTSLGRKLVLLNADPENPYVARLQVELINGF